MKKTLAEDDISEHFCAKCETKKPVGCGFYECPADDDITSTKCPYHWRYQAIVEEL